jgi:hypothetical protein
LLKKRKRQNGSSIIKLGLMRKKTTLDSLRQWDDHHRDMSVSNGRGSAYSKSPSSAEGLCMFRWPVRRDPGVVHWLGSWMAQIVDLLRADCPSLSYRVEGIVRVD